jgi:hypothetical protein
MTLLRPLLALCATALVVSVDAFAAPGDVFVPAHRTRDGHYVPPNVPPLSGGTHLARRPTRHRAVAPRAAKAKLAPPLLVDAPPVRR